MSSLKPCILFVVQKRDGRCHGDSLEFYAFDEDFVPIECEDGTALVEEKTEFVWTVVEDPQRIAQPFTQLEHCHQLAGYIGSGPQFFSVGGHSRYCDRCDVGRREHTPFSPTANCWDSNSHSWITCPRMILPRVLPHLHIVRGKLYAVGGYPFEYGAEAPFMEVMDHEKGGGWTAIPPPPPIYASEIDFFGFVSATIGHRHILFGFRSSGCFYQYTPPAEWTRLAHLQFDRSLFDQCIRLPALLVDDNLLWLRGTELIGLCLRNSSSFSISLADEGLLPSGEFVFSAHNIPKLVHVEAKVLALLWVDTELYAFPGEEEEEQVRMRFGGIHCTKFVVDFAEAYKSGSDCFTVISRQKCIGPSFHHCLSAAFMASVSTERVVR